MLQRGNENPYLQGKAPKKHVDCVLTQFPDLFGGLEGDARKRLVAEVGEHAEKQFTENLASIRELLHNYNPLQILSHFSYYDQLMLDGIKDSAGYRPTQQSAVEWLQALVLQVPEERLKEIMDNDPVGEPLLKMNKALHKAQEGFGLKRIGNRREDSPIHYAAELVRQHTAFIRNEGFPSQIKTLRREIFISLDDEFRKREGVSLSELDQALWGVSNFVRDNINTDLAQRRQILTKKSPLAIIREFAKLINRDAQEVTSEMSDFVDDRESLRIAITSHIDFHNFRHFSLGPKEFQSFFIRPIELSLCSKFLKLLSISWGELAKQNPEHLVLANPVWKRPFIDVGNDHYFIPIVGLIQSFGLEILEQCLERHPDLKKKYRDRARAEYLEKRTEALARRAFPDAQIFRGLKWKDEQGREGETDVVVLLDTHALVFECKSGAVRARAQRGDPAALRQELRELIDEPSLQGKRFADFLLAKRGILNLVDTYGVTQVLDCRGLLRITTVNVLLDYVGPVATQFRLLKESGVREEQSTPVATITLHDLECVVEILDQPAIALHYLRRRAEIESGCDIMAEELDLLAFYLATGFDVGDFEGDHSKSINIPTMAQIFEPYFMGKEIGIPTQKPRLKMRGWWRDMLNEFQENSFPGWLEASYTLLCANFDRQKEFETICKKLVREVRSNWHREHNNSCTMINGREEFRVAIVGLVIKRQSRGETRSIVRDRIGMVEEQHQAKRTLVICMSAGNRVYPYVGVYFHCPEMEVINQHGPPEGT